MLSIIVCSKYPVLPVTFLQNIDQTVGVDYEIVSIDNSENQYSIFSAYNLGIARSQYPYLCLVHEDVYFHTQNCGVNLIEHLSIPNVGIIGLAGGNYTGRIPASWSAYEKSINLIQSDKQKKKHERIKVPLDFNKSRREVVLLDGVFLAANKSLFDKINFDETLPGFHGYDTDISIQSTLAGFINYVAYDFIVEHFSHGYESKLYFENLIMIYKKWEKYLPLKGLNIGNKPKEFLVHLEEKRLRRLVHRLIVGGFSSDYIHAEVLHFTKLLNTPNAYKRLKILKLQIFYTRLFRCPWCLIR